VPGYRELDLFKPLPGEEPSVQFPFDFTTEGLKTIRNKDFKSGAETLARRASNAFDKMTVHDGDKALQVVEFLKRHWGRKVT